MAIDIIYIILLYITIIILSYTIILLYIIHIYYYILYYTLPQSSSSSPFPFLPSPSSPLLLSPSSSLLPSHLIYLPNQLNSFYTCRYLHTVIYIILFSSPDLSPILLLFPISPSLPDKIPISKGNTSSISELKRNTSIYL